MKNFSNTFRKLHDELICLFCQLVGWKHVPILKMPVPMPSQRWCASAYRYLHLQTRAARIQTFGRISRLGHHGVYGNVVTKFFINTYLFCLIVEYFVWCEKWPNRPKAQRLRAGGAGVSTPARGEGADCAGLHGGPHSP